MPLQHPLQQEPLCYFSLLLFKFIRIHVAFLTKKPYPPPAGSEAPVLGLNVNKPQFCAAICQGRGWAAAQPGSTVTPMAGAGAQPPRWGQCPQLLAGPSAASGGVLTRHSPSPVVSHVCISRVFPAIAGAKPLSWLRCLGFCRNREVKGENQYPGKKKRLILGHSSPWAGWR